MMEDYAVPALSAAGGAGFAGLVLKMVIQSWFKRHEDMSVKLDAMTIQLTRVEERVSTLQRTEERTHAQDRILAVIQAQLTDFQSHLNNLGMKVRKMAPST